MCPNRRLQWHTDLLQPSPARRLFRCLRRELTAVICFLCAIDIYYDVYDHYYDNDYHGKHFEKPNLWALEMPH